MLFRYLGESLFASLDFLGLFKICFLFNQTYSSKILPSGYFYPFLSLTVSLFLIQSLISHTPSLFTYSFSFSFLSSPPTPLYSISPYYPFTCKHTVFDYTQLLAKNVNIPPPPTYLLTLPSPYPFCFKHTIFDTI